MKIEDIQCFADFADFYDTEGRKLADGILTEFVHKHPNLMGVYIASVGANLFEGSSVVFVDIARIGSGTGSGSGKGVVEDIFRALSVIPVGKIAVGVRPLLGRARQFIANLTYWRKFDGPTCGPIAIGQALQRSGQVLGVKLETMTKAFGDKAAWIFRKRGGGATDVDIRSALKALGAHFDEITVHPGATWDDAVRIASNVDEPMLIPVVRRWEGQLEGHEILVQKVAGVVKIFDRYRSFNSLDELSRFYYAKKPGEFFGLQNNSIIFIVHNWRIEPALLSQLNGSPLAAVLVRVGMALGFAPGVSRAQVSEKLQSFVAGKQPHELYPDPVKPPDMAPVMYLHEVGDKVERKDWLSVIAEKWYKDQLLWPVIFDFNYGPDFRHPSKMYPRQRVKVPFPPQLSNEERRIIHQRALNWR